MMEQHYFKRRGKYFIVWFVVILTTVWILRSPAQALEYNYPYHDPYIATVTTAILDDGPDPRPKSSIVHVPGLAGRNRLPSLEGRGELSVLLYRQSRPAPLLFILSGIGANPFFGIATYLARVFYEQGFHIVILPSPMSWNFALSASRSGAPGYAPADARDLYEMMQKSLSILKDRHDVRITKIDFVGLSLGALEGAYLSVLDSDERKIGIEKYLLVDPPLDLSYALKKIDEWSTLKVKFGAEKSQGIISKAIGIVESFSDAKKDDPAVFEKFAKQFAGFTTQEFQLLIAADLQTLLPELVYVTQSIHDQKILTAARGNLRKRLREASDLTFMDYSEKIAVPLWRTQLSEPEADVESFMKKGSLASILDRLRGNSKVQIVHNADDPLTDKKSIEELKEALGDRVMVYPYGGHLGNIWYPQNREYALKLFKTAPELDAQNRPSNLGFDR
jgi:hypothetical protein